MGRRTAPMQPRKVQLRGEVRWEVRIDPQLRKQEGGQVRRLFRKEGEAKSYASRLHDNLRNYSDKARGLTDEQKIEAQHAYAKLAGVPGARLLDAVDLYLEHLNQKSRSVSVEELGERIVQDREAIGGRGSSEKTLIEIGSVWGRFADSFPGRLVNTLTPEEINDWLVKLTNVRDEAKAGQPISLQTRRNYRRVLSTVFGYAAARTRRWVSVNPVADVELPTSRRERVSLLSPEQTARLLAASVPELRPYFAICAFAGARPNQAAAISWSQIHLDRLEIEIPAGVDKTDRERIVPIQPNLAAFLSQVPESMRKGEVFHSRRWFVRATKDAGLRPWEEDVLRHGYGTYRFKIIGSFGTLADEMGNSEKVIRDRYYRSVSQATAEAYFALMPPALPEGYVYQDKLSRWTCQAALAARILHS